MDQKPFDVNSAQFQSFFEQYLNPIVLKIHYAFQHAQNKCKQNFFSSLYLIGFFSFLQIISHTILINYFYLAENWYNNLLSIYSKWYESKSIITRVFLPSNPFFFGFPHPWKFIIISFFILVWRSFIPLFKARLNQLEIFQEFCAFVDPKTKFLNHQQLKYLLNLNDFFTLPPHQNIALENNIEFQLGNHLFNFAQITLTSENNVYEFLRLFFPKHQINYKGLIAAGLLTQDPNRFVKIFIDHNNIIDFSAYLNLEEITFLNTNINTRVKIFSLQKNFNLEEKVILEILNNVDLIQQVNFAIPLYLDQVITDRIIDNVSERAIIAYNYVEITLSNDLITVLIPSNHSLFSFKSCFATIDIKADCNLLLNSLNLVHNLIKKLQ